MTWPPAAIAADKTNDTPSFNIHPGHHNDLAAAINAAVAHILANEAAWAAGVGGVAVSVFDAAGDLIVGTGNDTYARLPRGSALQVVRVNAAGTGLEYATPGGGVSGADLDRIETYSITGILSVQSGVMRLPFPLPATLLGVVAAVATAPAGAAIVLDVNKNGSTVFTNQANRPTIAAGANATAAEATPDVSAIAAGQYLTLDVDQIGSTTPGSDLSVVVRFRFT